MCWVWSCATIVHMCRTQLQQRTLLDLQVKIIHDLVHPNILRFFNWCARLVHAAECERLRCLDCHNGFGLLRGLHCGVCER